MSKVHKSRIGEEILAIVVDVIEIPAEEINPDDSFVDDLGVDSLMALEILAAIEKKYKIEVPEEYLLEIKTLNDTIHLAEKFLEVA